MATHLLLLLTSLIFFNSALAEIRVTKIRDDPRPIIPIDEFGFTASGHLDLDLTILSIRLRTQNDRLVALNDNPNSAAVDLSLAGFFLSTRDAWFQVLQQLFQNDIVCPTQSDLVVPVFSFRRLNRSGQTRFNVSVPVRRPNLFTLVFTNCIGGLEVSMDVTSSMFNLELGQTRDYVSAGKTKLPLIYFVFSLLYLTLMLIWGFVVYSKRSVIYRIHGFMLAVLILKAVNLLCEAEDKNYVKRTGSAHGWDVLFYVFSFLKGVTLFTLIVLIGTGWSFLKPYLQEKEKRVLMVVIPLQVVANVAQVVVDETGPYGSDVYTWKQVFLLVDIVCCCAVLFPIVWSIRSLREAARTDGKAAVNLMKLTLFRQYYVVVICYIYFTRVLVYALETITSYRFQWTSVVAGEVGTLVFYVFTGVKFRPRVHDPYFLIDDEEEEAAVEMLRLEEDEFDM